MACHDILFKEKSCLKIKVVYSVLLHIMIYIKLSVVFWVWNFNFFLILEKNTFSTIGTNYFCDFNKGGFCF